MLGGGPGLCGCRNFLAPGPNLGTRRVNQLPEKNDVMPSHVIGLVGERLKRAKRLVMRELVANHRKHERGGPNTGDLAG